jgi:hypothetical protein
MSTDNYESVVKKPRNQGLTMPLYKYTIDTWLDRKVAIPKHFTQV